MNPKNKAKAPATAPAAAVKEEKMQFDVILKDAGPNRINVVKVVRAVTGLCIKEAMGLVDMGGQAVKTGVTKEEAERVAKELRYAGAEVEITAAARFATLTAARPAALPSSSSPVPAPAQKEDFHRSIELHSRDHVLEASTKYGVRLRYGGSAIPFDTLDDAVAILQSLAWQGEALLEGIRVGGDSTGTLRAIVDCAEEKR